MDNLHNFKAFDATQILRSNLVVKTIPVSLKRFSDYDVPLKFIIIISLFQEDNIFGTNASLTYGPRLQR